MTDAPNIGLSKDAPRDRFGVASWVAMASGVALLFWQQDAAPVDFIFALSIAAAGVAAARGAMVGIRPGEILLLVAVGLSAAATLLAHGSLRAFGILAYLALVSLVVARLASSRPRQHTLEACIVFAMTISAVLLATAELSVAFGRTLEGFVIYGRAQGLFKDPNVAGVFASCALPLGSIWASRQARPGRVLFFVGALCTVSVLFSASRSALALLGAGVVLSVVMLRDRPHLVAALVGSVLAAAIALSGVVVPPTQYELIRVYDRGTRFAAWCYGAEMFLEAPLGTGAGSFEPRATERFENERPNCFGIQPDELSLTPSAHNTYLRVAVESGALGALALFAYWAMLILAPLRARERPDAWIAGFALVLAAGLTIDTLHWRQLWLYAGVLSTFIGTPKWVLRGRSS